MKRRRVERAPESSPREMRRAFAELLRHFFAGRMTNDEYERRCDAIVRRPEAPPETEDIYGAAWHLYDDVWRHRMTGRRRPTPALRRRIARWIVFLYSDADYVRPGPALAHPEAPRRSLPLALACGVIALPGVLVLAAALAIAVGFPGPSLMLAATACAAWAGVWLAGSRSSVLGSDVAFVVDRAFSNDSTDPWPFASLEDLAAALARPRLLAGGRS